MVCSVVILRCFWVAPQKYVSLVVSLNGPGTATGRDVGTGRDEAGRDEIFRPVDNPVQDPLVLKKILSKI